MRTSATAAEMLLTGTDARTHLAADVHGWTLAVLAHQRGVQGDAYLVAGMARDVVKANRAVRAVEVRGDLVAGLRIEDEGRGEVFVLPRIDDVAATQLREPVRHHQVRVG